MTNATSFTPQSIPPAAVPQGGNRPLEFLQCPLEGLSARVDSAFTNGLLQSTVSSQEGSSLHAHGFGEVPAKGSQASLHTEGDSSVEEGGDDLKGPVIQVDESSVGPNLGDGLRRHEPFWEKALHRRKE